MFEFVDSFAALAGGNLVHNTEWPQDSQFRDSWVFRFTFVTLASSLGENEREPSGEFPLSNVLSSDTFGLVATSSRDGYRRVR